MLFSEEREWQSSRSTVVQKELQESHPSSSGFVSFKQSYSHPIGVSRTVGLNKNHTYAKEQI